MSFSLHEQEWEHIKRAGNPGDWNVYALVSEAMYRGGEALIQSRLKNKQYLPHNLEEVIDEGMKVLSQDIIQLKPANQIAKDIRAVVVGKKGYALIRVGDGELLAMAHDIFISSEEIRNDPKLNYAMNMGGFNYPDHERRQQLTENMLKADLVGIPESRFPTYQRLFNKLADFHGWPLKELNLATSLINYELNDETFLFHELLSTQKVLLVGNKSREGKSFFENLGYDSIVGTVTVDKIRSVEQTLSEIRKHEFDIAFISAGIAANLIAVELAQEGKIAIDFGHLMDWLSNGITNFNQRP
ncbi:hypothetical protein HNR44_001164 [Geomicrobium halophilum]|uniref:GT-D fold-like domain-containing protein n=1 Tax=Geomicrobium halophilum TaxID=549000 RepID=A0A841PYG6_9BACL|nr:GT-D fold domain-containing glycosyltransferase [Geomicrobium halophilum]MBB6449215.1 hypothetical protein [Geomicrobium halophilum]